MYSLFCESTLHLVVDGAYNEIIKNSSALYSASGKNCSAGKEILTYSYRPCGTLTTVYRFHSYTHNSGPIHNDTYRTALQTPYESPYKVVKYRSKFFVDKSGEQNRFDIYRSSKSTHTDYDPAEELKCKPNLETWNSMQKLVLDSTRAYGCCDATAVCIAEDICGKLSCGLSFFCILQYYYFAFL
ncbi:hypothetical protein RF11_09513 [Thelohanellus kitauei]|uniref:Uncharacterized protein n=1 Tax=Thelohanellus kitauei TaxID=669202 RepID=A0A0C2JGY9_THEKT|nr:hypothetical protein RF11_09513 [Thelohanellus kitauei]